jgi:hypothetical protein
LDRDLTFGQVFHKRLAVGSVGQVTGDDLRAHSAVVADLGGDALQPIEAPRDQQHVVTGGGELAGQLCADAGRRAGHNCPRAGSGFGHTHEVCLLVE